MKRCVPLSKDVDQPRTAGTLQHGRLQDACSNVVGTSGQTMEEKEGALVVSCNSRPPEFPMHPQAAKPAGLSLEWTMCLPRLFCLLQCF